ncbi:MAG: hypothetical protein ACRDS0_10420 [Pseudonocardiaceae bacterium]
MNISRGAALRRLLAILVTAAGLAAAGCGNNAGNPPGTPPTAPSSPAVSSTPPTRAPPTRGAWAKSMCQALGLAFIQLGEPPQPDLGNLTATRQTYIDYLGRAATVVQQATDQLAFLGAPPVSHGQQILDRLRTQLIQLHDNLDDAVTQLKAANPNDASGIGPILAAAGNAVGLAGTLTSDPELRAAFDQTPECQNVPL